MKTHAIRFLPGSDLKLEIAEFLKRETISAGAILSCVGSLKNVRLRMAGAKTLLEKTGPHEIISLSGTLSIHGSHLHLSVSDQQGQCFGGHLTEGCVINTTFELIIAELPNFTFKRAFDPATGFDELLVEKS
jgi:predicted DNA-binding protein with PD1-like motif